MGLGHFGGKEVIPLKEGNKEGNITNGRGKSAIMTQSIGKEFTLNLSEV